MKDGTVFLYKYDKNKNYGSKLANFIMKCIVFFTRSPYWHIAVKVGNYTYQNGSPYGVKKDTKTRTGDKYTVLEPKRDLTEKEIQDMIKWGDLQLEHNLGYNHFKLIILAIVYPTRKFWNWVGWIPFQNDYFGMVCSVFIDETFYFMVTDV